MKIKNDHWNRPPDPLVLTLNYEDYGNNSDYEAANDGELT